jgi:integrase
VVVKKKRKRAPRRYWVVIKGKLYARLQYQAEDGRYVAKYKPITDKRTAKRVVDDMRLELETHGEEILRTDKMTCAELIREYEKTKLVSATYSNGIKVSGRRSLLPAKSALKPIVSYFGRKLVRSIKARDLESYKNERLTAPVEVEVKVKIGTGENAIWRKEKRVRPRKVASVNRELELLRAIFNFAVQNEWLIKNPFGLAKGIISKAAEVERNRVLSPDEEQRLLAACVDRRAHLNPLIICALDTGMRRGEMFKMRWRDIDFGSGEIFIPQTNTKTEVARSVGMTPRLRAALEDLWAESPQSMSGLAFGPLVTVKVAWKSACDLAKLKNFRLHDCRHTATTRMIASGSPHTEVMKITGHSQLKTFLRYLNITPQSARAVASRLDTYLAEQQASLNAAQTDSIN